jgi:hypothetical protein
MNQKHVIILIAIAVVLLCCCCFVIAGAGGLIAYQTAKYEASSWTPSIPQEPTPIPIVIQRETSSAEERTAEIIVSAELPERDLADLAHRLLGVPEPLPEVSTSPAGEYDVGDAQVFWVHDVRTNEFFTATATLEYATPHAYWWVENGYEVPSKALEGSALRFENNTYPTARRIFGSEWNPGVDGDPHIYLYLGYVPGVGGYFSGPDEYPVEIRPHSNEHEIFYVNLDNAGPGSEYFDGLIAHEFQHMIHWAMDRDEDGWVNEGLSELASRVTGYDVGGSDLLFRAVPDTQLNAWAELEDSGPHYGASYMFLSYFFDQYGEDAIRRLVEEEGNGIAAFETVLAEMGAHQQDFVELFADWVVANYADDGETVGRYGYADLEVSAPALAAQHALFPVYAQATVHQFAADYILLDGEGDFTVEFTGTQLVPLLGNRVRDGEYQWWSMRGDDSDATLTRGFDLTGLSLATLEAWLWYDLEEDYDYGYVEVSTDDGETWTLLASEHTTSTNPSGNSYGPAFTGISGSGADAEWVLERFDLSPFAGNPILVRFEVITDEAMNQPGMAIDGISIPELGYSHDSEDPDQWLAQGWLRVSDQIPQSFVVQLITFGRETRVERLEFDEHGRGELTITGLGDDIESAVLVVSGITPVTTEWASYAYRITQD